MTRDIMTGTPMETNPINGKPMSELRAKTEEISQYIRDQGYNLVEMYECEWNRIVCHEPDVQAHIEDNFSSWSSKHRWSLSEEALLRAIEAGDLFGLVEVDIEVPEEDRHLWAEMPPIFKNADVSLNVS